MRDNLKRCTVFPGDPLRALDTLHALRSLRALRAGIAFRPLRALDTLHALRSLRAGIAFRPLRSCLIYYPCSRIRRRHALRFGFGKMIINIPVRVRNERSFSIGFIGRIFPFGISQKHGIAKRIYIVFVLLHLCRHTQICGVYYVCHVF